jgi:hypothetical protein
MICNGPVEAGGRVFDVVKHVTASAETKVERHICGDCADKERKREAARAHERAIADAVTKAMRT